MTPTILQNFFSRRATRRYPDVAAPVFANARGELHNDIAACVFCGVCAAKCPSRCITVDKQRATWQYDPFACVFCGVCVEACTTSALHQSSHYRNPAAVREHVHLEGHTAREETGPSATDT